MSFLPHAEHFVAIDNLAAFPALLKLPDGTLGALIYNHPSHVRGPASGVEMWASADGALWERRGVVSSGRTAEEIHANHAVGINPDGELVAIVGRYRAPSGGRPRGHDPPVIGQSSDAGRSWRIVGELASPIPDQVVVPFGNIDSDPNGLMTLSVYCSAPAGSGDEELQNGTFVMRSRDGGRTWSDPYAIEADNHNETALLRLKNGRWLAAARTLNCDCPAGTDGQIAFWRARLDLFESNDGARQWAPKAHLTFPGQHPAHLLELNDGRILLTYGSRMPHEMGVQFRLSEDGGTTWSAPTVLVNGLDSPDCGYPATVQLKGGRLVTVYYAANAPWHRRYHMGVVRYEV